MRVRETIARFPVDCFHGLSERAGFAATVALALLALGACTSPEATRLRAGGPGADPQNRRAVVAMHEGSRPYDGTPRLIGSYGTADLEPARQADRLATPRHPWR